MATSELSKRAVKQKQLVASGNVSDADLPNILTEAWHDLCHAQGSTLKEFSSCRALLDACVPKCSPNVLSTFGICVMDDILQAGHANDVSLFSRRLLAALDCESVRRCLKNELIARSDSAQLIFEQVESIMTVLQSHLEDGDNAADRRWIETLKNAERFFDCVARINAILASSDSDIKSAIKAVVERLMELTRMVMIKQGQRDVHVLRSAGLAFSSLNSLLVEPISCITILRESTRTLPMVRSALLLGVLSTSSSGGQEDLDNALVLEEILDVIADTLASTANETEKALGYNPVETDNIEPQEGRVDQATISCEALCAWCTRVKSCVNCPARLVLRAMNIALLYMGHPDASIGSICSNAFDRLVETCSRVGEGDSVLAEVFVDQMKFVAMADFALAKRGLYPLVQKLISALGAQRVDELTPGGFVSVVLNSAFRDGEVSSNRSELGNGICNLISTYFEAGLIESDYKITKTIVVELVQLANILQKGPTNLFASYFVARHLLTDLLREARSPREADAMREIARVILQALGHFGVRASGSNNATDGQHDGLRKRTHETSVSELEASVNFNREDDDNSLWARLSVLLAMERAGYHVTLIIDDNENAHEDSRKRKRGSNARLFAQSREVKYALGHSTSELREVAWALLSSRVKRSKFPEPIASRMMMDELDVVMKHDAFALKPSLVRIIERIAFALEAGGAGEDEGDEEARVQAMALVRSFSESACRSIYPGAPFERIGFALDLASCLLKTYAKSSFCRLVSPLILPGVIRSFIETLRSPFDSARALAFDFLRNVPGPLPGLSSGKDIERFLSEEGWVERLFAPMRRDADSSALILRLLHDKYCVELGYKLSLSCLLDEGHLEGEGTADARIELEESIGINRDAYYMRLAQVEARKCITVPTAYDVGCVIVSPDYMNVLATGFSRELPGNTHAEECALRKLGEAGSEGAEDDTAKGMAMGTIMYTTMEPCSLRLSGNRPCASRVIAAKCSRVVVGVKEPDKFVQNCEGWTLLQKEGIAVSSVRDDEVLDECALLAKNDHSLPKEFDAKITINRERAFNNRDLDRLSCSRYFYEQLLDVVDSAGSSMTEVDIPLHGVLMTLKYIVKDFPETCPVERLLHSLSRTLSVGVDTLIDIEAKERMTAEDDDEEFLTKTTTWLTVREGSELLCETLDALISRVSSPAVVPKGPGKKKSIGSQPIKQANGAVMASVDMSILIERASWFLATVLRLRHLGAMMYVAKGLERVTKRLLLCPQSDLQSTPVRTFLPTLFERLSDPKWDRALRRTEGFAQSFRAVSRASHFAGRFDIVQSVFRNLLDTASQAAAVDPDASSEGVHTIVATLNVLHVLFDDAVLGKSVTRFVSNAVELAVGGFASQHWAIRNSSLNLFVAVVKRATGEPDQQTFVENSLTQQRAHSVTAKLFFQTHPRLFPFLKSELIKASEASSTGSGFRSGSPDHPSLHPVLLFLSSLRRSGPSTVLMQASSREPDDPALAFVEPLKRLALHFPGYIIRSLASRALLVLTPPDRFDILALSHEVKCGVTANSRHGALLQIKLWTSNGTAKDNVLVEGALGTLVHTLFENARNENETYLCRAVALEALGNLVHGDQRFLALLAGLVDTEKTRKMTKPVEPDGFLIGRQRFWTTVADKVVVETNAAGDWSTMLKVLQCEHMASAACEALVVALGRTSKFPASQAQELVDQLFRLVPSLPRSQIASALTVIRLWTENGNRQSIRVTTDQIQLVLSILGSESSEKAHSACLLLLSSFLVRANTLKEEIETALLQALEEDAKPSNPLGIRLAAAEALKKGCLVNSSMKSGLRFWLCALRLLQDADMEVCEEMRVAVARAIGGDLASACLGQVFQSTFSFVTKKYSMESLWWNTLVDWIFTGAVDDDDGEDSSRHDKDEADATLFKVDRDNEFMEPEWYSILACHELLTIKRDRLLAKETGIIDQNRALALRANDALSKTLERLRTQRKKGLAESHSALVATLCSILAFGDRMDTTLINNFVALHTEFGDSMSTMAHSILRQCEGRLL